MRLNIKQIRLYGESIGAYFYRKFIFPIPALVATYNLRLYITDFSHSLCAANHNSIFLIENNNGNTKEYNGQQPHPNHTFLPLISLSTPYPPKASFANYKQSYNSRYTLTLYQKLMKRTMCPLGEKPALFTNKQKGRSVSRAGAVNCTLDTLRPFCYVGAWGIPQTVGSCWQTAVLLGLRHPCARLQRPVILRQSRRIFPCYTGPKLLHFAREDTSLSAHAIGGAWAYASGSSGSGGMAGTSGRGRGVGFPAGTSSGSWTGPRAGTSGRAGPRSTTLSRTL